MLPTPAPEALAQLADLDRRTSGRCLKPPPKLTVSTWADTYRQLSREASAEPGRWITARAEYQRGILDAFSDPAAHTVVVMAASQTGKTELVLNLLGYFVHQDPAPILLVEPRIEDAKALSKDRIAPMVRDTPALRALLPAPRTRDSGNTVLHKTFPGGHLTLAGANSPAGLAMRPIRVALFDEVDRYPPSAGSEGDPVALGTKRTATFWNRKVVLCSSPGERGRSRIEEAYLQSDQRRYWVPCPHCDQIQLLRWANVRWDKGAGGRHLPLTALYHCEACGAGWTDGERWAAVRRGAWQAEAPFRGVAGFHISELYSPWKRLFETVQEFLDAKENPERLRTWINTALAETYQARGEAPEAERLYERRETYRRGVVPRRGLILTAGVDVQRDQLEVELVAWGRGLESWSVEYLVLAGDPARPEVWQALADLLHQAWPRENGGAARLARMAVDSGFETQAVYDFRRRIGDPRVILVKGTDRLPQPLGVPSWVGVNWRGRRLKRGVQVWPVGVSHLKAEFYAHLRLAKPEGDEPTPRYCHFPQYGREHFDQLTAEQVVEVRGKGGYARREWQKVHPRNEALDCRIYARAAAAHLGMDQWSAARWQKLEADLGVAVAPAPAPAPAEPAVNPAPPPQRRPDADWLGGRRYGVIKRGIRL